MSQEAATPGVEAISGWHAHVYFDAESRAQAWALRERIGLELASELELGRFHERPVGPHPMWSFQLAFLPEALRTVLSWLVLHHDGLDVLVHPNTDDALGDHRDRALWLGRSHRLDLQALGGPGPSRSVPGASGPQQTQPSPHLRQQVEDPS